MGNMTGMSTLRLIRTLLLMVTISGIAVVILTYSITNDYYKIKSISQWNFSVTSNYLQADESGFIINEKDFCSQLPLPVDSFNLAYIHTNPLHFQHRKFIRTTWGSRNNFNLTRLLVIFVLGVSTDDSVNDRIYNESQQYHDIIQSDFIDSYKNLSYKGISALKWIQSYCPNAEFILKSDDDIFVNIFKLLPLLNSSTPRDSLLCNVWVHMPILRVNTSKWYVSEEDFAGKYFPKYCSGSAFILTPGSAGRLYEASKKVPVFWVDDVYVSGLLAAEGNVSHVRLNGEYNLLSVCTRKKLIEDKYVVFTHLIFNFEECEKIWRIVVRKEVYGEEVNDFKLVLKPKS